MKNSLANYKRLVKKLIPHWSGRDIGHTASRDWYTSLMLAFLVGLAMVGVGAVSYRSVHQLISERADTLPVRGLPITEERIMYVWNLFEMRNAEFDEYVANMPSVPNLERATPLEVEPSEIPEQEDSP